MMIIPIQIHLCQKSKSCTFAVHLADIAIFWCKLLYLLLNNIPDIEQIQLLFTKSTVRHTLNIFEIIIEWCIRIDSHLTVPCKIVACFYIFIHLAFNKGISVQNIMPDNCPTHTMGVWFTVQPKKAAHQVCPRQHCSLLFRYSTRVCVLLYYSHSSNRHRNIIFISKLVKCFQCIYIQPVITVRKCNPIAFCDF